MANPNTPNNKKGLFENSSMKMSKRTTPIFSALNMLGVTGTSNGSLKFLGEPFLVRVFQRERAAHR